MEQMIASVIIFAGNFAPKDWMFCRGQMLSINSYPALYSLIGTLYGGNGITTFALPDLSGRVPLGAGQSPGLSNYVLASKAGVENVTLGIHEIPSHTHAINLGGQESVLLSTDDAVNETPQAGDVPAVANFESGESNQKVKSFGPASNTVNGQPINDASRFTTLPTGGGLAHYNMQPYLAMNYIIAVNGIYPSRN